MLAESASVPSAETAIEVTPNSWPVKLVTLRPSDRVQSRSVES